MMHLLRKHQFLRQGRMILRATVDMVETIWTLMIHIIYYGLYYKQVFREEYFSHVFI